MHAGVAFVVIGLAIQLRGFVVVRRHCADPERLLIGEAASDPVPTDAVEPSPPSLTQIRAAAR